MRFIHSADWQIGKVFKQFGVKEEALRQARLGAVERLGQLARTHGVAHVLVAGDVYDSEAPNPITLREPIERIKLFPDIQWHLLPGNHDPHRPEGIWDRLAKLGLPGHVHLHLSPVVVPLGDGAFLMPAPLCRKTEYDDVTMWMDSAPTPAGAVRIGLAHGSIVNFGQEGEASNPIDPARPSRAGLDYLALGDWHRTMQVGPCVWYSGTPEPDRAGRQEAGTALLVDIAGAGAPPAVTPLATGTYRWITRSERVADVEAGADLDQRLRAEPDLAHTIVRLKLEGALSIAAAADLQRRLVDLEAAAFHLEVDQTELVVRPTEADLEMIDFDGVLARAADRLKGTCDDPAQSPDRRRHAKEALVDLFVRVASKNGKEAA
ncbi:exonuclease SbcCD subunit D [Bradyrhizobium sp. ma5]|uniref:metallophosphoesterase family protein n=1 Tax=Bradyrhizobium sp. ma5 TaxID=3344828 RepID=UPI0035D3DFC3